MRRGWEGEGKEEGEEERKRKGRRAEVERRPRKREEMLTVNYSLCATTTSTMNYVHHTTIQTAALKVTGYIMEHC